MTSNPKQISGIGTTAQVRDNLDVIHTGIIKALNTMVSGNKIISGCDITQSASTGSGGGTTLFTVSAGQYLQDNQLVAFGGSTIKLNTATNEFTNPAGIQTPHASNDYYALLVIDTAGALKIRGDNSLASTTPVIASYTLGDTLLSNIKIEGGSDVNDATRELQFLTVNKAKNSVSLAHDDSGTYTETSSLIGGATGTNWQSVAAKSIIVNDDGVDTDFIIEGNTDTDLFVVDALENAIGIGKTIGVGEGGTYKLMVDGITHSTSYDGGGIVCQPDTSGGEGTIILRRNRAGSGSALIKFSTTTAPSISYPSGDDVDITYDKDKNWVFDASQALNTKMQVTGIVHASDDVIAGGDLQTISNIIRDSGGSNTIQFDGANNTTIVSNATIGGVLQANTSATVGTTLVATDTITSGRGLVTDGFISLEPLVETFPVQPLITPGFSVYYLINSLGFPLVELPDANPLAHQVITIKNVDVAPIIISGAGSSIHGPVGGQPIDGNVFPIPSNPLLTAINEITLAPSDSITLQAHTDGAHPLVTGWYIIS